ncbi:MAG: hypothetical protein IT349_16635, partial [Candidatus Eisenbacteria bacterium]|nr:hypothetical protein [Candidatus Eisenbacteria bacterium]
MTLTIPYNPSVTPVMPDTPVTSVTPVPSVPTDSTRSSTAEARADRDLSSLPDGEVLRSVARWATAEREATAELLRCLGELDARRLYLGAGCSSTFAYCTDVLRMSEPAAYHRITAARAGRRFPPLLARLAAGDLHLSGICLLASELTEANLAWWIESTRGKSKRAIERMLASERAARPAASRTVVEDAGIGSCSEERSIPALEQPTRSASAPAPAPVLTLPAVAVSEPVAATTPARAGSAVAAQSAPEPGRSKLSLMADPELLDLIAKARDLVSHSNPSGDLATLLRLALRALIATTERRRFGSRPVESTAPAVPAPSAPVQTAPVQTAPVQAALAPAAQARIARVSDTPPSTPSADPLQVGQRHRTAVITPGPRDRSRRIPTAVRRAVWLRDGGRCAFLGRDGHRCGTRAFLQFHHRIEFACGGEHTVENLTLRCGPHNRYESSRRSLPVDERVLRARLRDSRPGRSNRKRDHDRATLRPE